MRRIRKILLFLLAVSSPALAAGKAPRLELKDLQGHSHSLASFKGQVVVLSFWAIWCGPCKEELPRLSTLQREYAGKGVRFVAVSIDAPKDRPGIGPFLQRNQIDLDVWVGADTDTLARFGLGDIVPGTIVLDQQGAVMGRIMGEAQAPDIRSRVDWLLGGRQGAAPDVMLKRY